MISSRFRWNSSTLLELTRPKIAYIYYRTTRHNLITGYPETYPLQKFLDSLDEKMLQDKVRGHHVYHFHYELGLVLLGLGHSVSDDVPLAIEIEYESARKTSLPRATIDQFPLKSLERPNWSEYKEVFQYIQEQLHAGNCYQVNVTSPFEFETEEPIDPRDINSFFFSRKGLGTFAHSTIFHDQMILSNSPECLFQYKNNEVRTMPIKGTMRRKGTLKEDWRELLESTKDEAELLMITDLLRNDLNRLDRPIARVLKKRAALEVPGLLHQYSLLSVKLSKKISLLHVLTCLFPGGSVTGAPKKRVMQIIQDVEHGKRGVYCGSTLLCYGNKKVASINIRTAEIDLSERLWKYGAGGGITLGSNAVHEYQEMEAKVASFLTLISAPGYVQKPE
ncbi:MAG: chorismate-binding protein [Bacteriovoracaceae bacterium]